VKLALHVVALLLSLASFETLSAQPFFAPVGSLPPYEALAIVRSKGLDPVSRPVRQGPVYVLRALNPGGQEFRVMVDATTGRIVKVVAVAPTDPGGFAPPASIPSVRTVPDGNGPNPRMAVVPPDSDDDFEPLHPAPAVAAPKTPSRTAGKPAPPLPRPRPKEIAAAPAAEPMSSTGPTSSTGSINSTGASSSTGPSGGPGASGGTGSSSSVGASSSTGASTGPSASAEYTAPQFLELDE
jgi:uncharacterized membrane protein YgcG